MATVEGGFPHSEIHGSKPVRGSPWLIAAYHVLHRLSAPRHPPDTLKTLDRSHYRCPSRTRPKALPARHRRSGTVGDGAIKTYASEPVRDGRRSRLPIVMPRVPRGPQRHVSRRPAANPESTGWSRPVGSVRTPGCACRASPKPIGRTHSLFTMSNNTPRLDGAMRQPAGPVANSGMRTRGALRGRPDRTVPARAIAEAMVEQDGIEPTTSCLQSTRSPN